MSPGIYSDCSSSVGMVPGWSLSAEQSDRLSSLGHVISYCFPSPGELAMPNILHAFRFVNPKRVAKGLRTHFDISRRMARYGNQPLDPILFPTCATAGFS